MTSIVKNKNDVYPVSQYKSRPTPLLLRPRRIYDSETPPSSLLSSPTIRIGPYTLTRSVILSPINNTVYISISGHCTLFHY